MAAQRIRGYQVRRFPPERRLVTAAVRRGGRMSPMIGLLELDVTEANRLLALHDPPLSFTAFVVASVARAAANHPGVHAYRDWLGRVVTHDHVDVATLVEISAPNGLFGLPHVLHDADVRTVADLGAELHRVKGEPVTSSSGRWLLRAASTGTRLPGVVPAMYAVMARSIAARQKVGTVAVTAVGMFAGGGGYGMTPMSLMSCEVVVGGVSQRPRAVDGRIELREVLDLTVAIDHDVVDGAPATRFAAELRTLIETAAVLA